MPPRLATDRQFRWGFRRRKSCSIKGSLPRTSHDPTHQADPSRSGQSEEAVRENKVPQSGGEECISKSRRLPRLAWKHSTELA